MYYIYILQSKKDKSFYTGFTEDLNKRIKDHNWYTASLKLRSTSEVRYTRSKAPFELVWYCAFKSKKKALDFEKYLKQGSGFAFARKRLT
ncbi:MAG: GIY-YIG nuclease family protein [Patescibacteria group bacterium]